MLIFWASIGRRQAAALHSEACSQGSASNRAPSLMQYAQAAILFIVGLGGLKALLHAAQGCLCVWWLGARCTR